MLFVDGLGLGLSDATVNPIVSGACPCLEHLLAQASRPLDATLGIPGIPQSATGQTALLTGINAAAERGRHVEGFPGPELRVIIARGNVFARLLPAGIRCTFANAYYIASSADVPHLPFQSVTTVATLSALGVVRTREDLAHNRAVYHDLTRETLRRRGYTGPLVSPREAAIHLTHLATEFDFTLFEYFQTDRAGHARDHAYAQNVLRVFDAFLAELVERANCGDFLLVLTSDHGNIEDLRTSSHTCHPVPLVVVGPNAHRFLDRPLCSLLDVAPALCAWFDVATTSLRPTDTVRP